MNARGWFRAVVASGLVLGHLAIIGLGVVALVWLFSPLTFFVLVAAFVAAVVVAVVVATGRWAPAWWCAPQVAATVGLCGLYVAAALYALGIGINDFTTRAAIGTPATDIGTSIAGGAFAIIAIGVLITALPLPGKQRTAVIVGAVPVVTGVVGGLAAIAIGAGTDTCDRFRVDPARWRSAQKAQSADARRMARAIDNCGTVDGADRATVRRLLGGSNPSARREWIWSLGSTGGGFGTTYEALIVAFGRDGRARHVYVNRIYD